MPEYERITNERIEANQWHRNGDHPDDNSHEVKDTATGIPFLSEGEVVRRFRRPGVTGAEFHQVCGHIWDDHGWIEPTKSHGQRHWEDGLVVCPGAYVITDQVWVNGRATYSVAGKKAFERSYRPVQLPTEVHPHEVPKALAYADVYAQSLWDGIAKEEQRNILEATGGRGVLVIPDEMLDQFNG